MKARDLPIESLPLNIPPLIVVFCILGLTCAAYGTLVFPTLGNAFIAVFCVVDVLSAVSCFNQESFGNNMKYSKFSSLSNSNAEETISSKAGMLLFYFPSFLIALIYATSLIKGINIEAILHLPFSIGLNGYHTGIRFPLLAAIMTVHFGKRVLETLFVHNYSGSMALSSARSIPIHYLLSTFATLLSQAIADGLPSPGVDLMIPGVILSVVGLCGNLYHHILLSNLRKISPEGKYVIPEGGLFGEVVCPHYAFEILGFWGYAFVSQTIVGFATAIFTTFYLAGRSQATLAWYRFKFRDFPRNRKAIIPRVI